MRASISTHISIVVKVCAHDTTGRKWVKFHKIVWKGNIHTAHTKQSHWHQPVPPHTHKQNNRCDNNPFTKTALYSILLCKRNKGSYNKTSQKINTQTEFLFLLQNNYHITSERAMVDYVVGFLGTICDDGDNGDINIRTLLYLWVWQKHCDCMTF